jgi:two-component system, OmpR family, sensor kinase
MSATPFRARRGGLEALWGLFAAANIAVMVVFGSWEMIPFYLVWLSLALLYGFRAWSVTTTVVLVLAVMLVTGVALVRVLVQAGDGWDELAADPFMAGLFAAMAWHSRRRQAALDELRRATYERDFVRDASHQLRTPIAVARGHAELVLETHPRSPVAADVKVIADELERLSTISDRLLLLVAAEQPGFVDPSPVEIESLVEGTVMRWRPVASRRWRARVMASGTLLLDRERVTCALDALIENAVNATRDGELIEIAARVDGDTATIDVIDEGAGIAPAERERIFGRFCRGSGNGRSRHGGAGLGLPVVKAIAEAHAGSVTVRGEPAKGTTIRLRLKAVEPSPSQAAPVTRSRIRPEPAPREAH